MSSVSVGLGESSGLHGSAGETLTPATWRDPKRYLWLLGLFVPTLPFLASTAPCSSSRSSHSPT
jgi:hypothetical protein